METSSCLETTQKHSSRRREGVSACGQHAISRIKHSCHSILCSNCFSSNLIDCLLASCHRGLSVYSLYSCSSTESSKSSAPWGICLWPVLSPSPLTLSACPLLVPCSSLRGSPDGKRSRVTGSVGVLISLWSALELDLHQLTMVLDIIDG